MDDPLAAERVAPLPVAGEVVRVREDGVARAAEQAHGRDELRVRPRAVDQDLGPTPEVM